MERKQVFYYQKEMRGSSFVFNQQYVGGRWLLFDYALVILDPFCRQPRKSPNLISEMLEEIYQLNIRKSYITFMLLFDECSICYCHFSIKMHLLYCCQKIDDDIRRVTERKRKMGKNNGSHKKEE